MGAGRRCRKGYGMRLPPFGFAQDRLASLLAMTVWGSAWRVLSQRVRGGDCRGRLRRARNDGFAPLVILNAAKWSEESVSSTLATYHAKARCFAGGSA
jgi:hypothetical protein